ncbi:Tim44 domain-containing protein [Geminicoccus harenae]|uniref:Tim44 domain-containing protein n=2 Tax=Geminicoccus harenae TaxID=2498453 RepID=UPI00210413F3
MVRKSATSSKGRWHRLAALTLVMVLALGAGVAEARKGGSFGSRGARTYQAPMATPTAPGQATPMQRSATQQQAGPSAAAPAAQQARGGMFSRGGFMPGLMGGLLGAGLFGMLFGGGFFGGLGSFAGVLGFLLQIALVVVIVRLAMNFFRSRQAPAYAGAAGGRPVRSAQRAAGGPMAGGLGGTAKAARPGVRDEIGITTADYTAFENSLRTVQTAYGQEDRAALRGAVTPEMFGYFVEELEANHAQGRVNRLADISLLQGDLAEAWREGPTEYATVAMRYSMKDWTEDRASGAVVTGDPNRPEQITEIWTFSRPRGGEWVLSAIQQAS